ncbi:MULTISPECIES: LysR substrate-binding domain-containing protein [unclassified Sphingomonas]|uniref:LysR substrate-binding domain-containing protein n=1 Tax=unclassified Sphingomonas TaxID=196159 RepID=UPI0006FD3AAA|nr:MULTISPECIES: LysR substrate-binding domain-containing protein [unclassified Sphingomonas]KQX18631.1 LysR family transcriptional regulator [Sphingomonas sp. Root1294]KQY72046.1 LysR family transcriptional regulator [Sphingomonas sp. Root50]KRB94685.1 LysR family transcriptional regulator [Sphingomonas sp. Root720]
MFDPVWLTSFIAVAETSSFTAAAARLGLRQSTVSEHIRKLEAVCAHRLFIRDTHSVMITRDGEAMMGFATSILETSARAMRHFAGDDVHGKIRLGVSEDVVLSGLPHVLRRFTGEYPRVELELTVGLSQTLRQSLDAGDLDIVFLKRRVGDCYGHLVWREPLIWIASPEFRLDAGRPVPLIVLTQPAFTRQEALEALERHGRRWRFACSSDSQSGVHAAALAGLGVAPHAKSLKPAGLVEITDAYLPPLADTEFVVIAGRAANKGATAALSDTLRASSMLLRRRLS